MQDALVLCEINQVVAVLVYISVKNEGLKIWISIHFAIIIYLKT